MCVFKLKIQQMGAQIVDGLHSKHRRRRGKVVGGQGLKLKKMLCPDCQRWSRWVYLKNKKNNIYVSNPKLSLLIDCMSIIMCMCMCA